MKHYFNPMENSQCWLTMMSWLQKPQRYARTSRTNILRNVWHLRMIQRSVENTIDICSFLG
jgi:hypothetical protein